MTRKVARQSETTPTHTVDEYLWNERLGVAAIPPIDTAQNQPQTSSLPPQSSAAPTIDYDAANAQSDMFGSGVSSEGQAIAPKTPNTTPASIPARARAAAISSTNQVGLDNCPGCGKRIKDFDEDGYECHNGQRWCGTHHPQSCTDHGLFDNKTSAVSTVYGDVEPTPTTGESGNDGSQANRNNSSEKLPNGPDSGGSPTSPAAVGEEAGGAGLAADIGEAASIAALASKHWIGSTLDPKESKKDKEEGHYKYVKKRGDKWVIIQKGTGKVLSTHDSREKAIASFKAMMMSKHGG